ncbi:MAG: T9SS type A sorting domain-containing protein [Ginsengibacter sp.]
MDAAVDLAKAATVTANNQTKYCGQTLTFAGTEFTTDGLVNSDVVNSVTLNSDGATSGASTSGSPYSIVPIGAIGTGLKNYDISYINGALTILPITSIDASASSNTYAVNTQVTLSATISPAVSGVPVTFTLDPGTGVTTSYTISTDANGVATTYVSGLSVNLYKVIAVAGSECATSNAAYLTVYDPNAGFVTGGGWINSPAGAYDADPTLTGKANFGFNAQYKKGNNTPDGNTEFQFQAGNLNFKSTNYSTGSLVIAGAKAIFQGTGTINGTGNYKFTLSAIDGKVNGGGVDMFRIKIQTAGGGVVYDNNQNSPDNADPSTVLGGGSIVIHNANGKKSRVMNSSITASPTEVNSNQASDQSGTGALSVKVLPNPTSYYFTAGLQSLSKESVSMVVTDITGRVIEQRTNIAANSTIQFGSSYRPGTYIVQFLQGTDKVTLKLIKEGE